VTGALSLRKGRPHGAPPRHLWLNEGHATWYEVVYAAEHGQLAEDTAGQFNDAGYPDLESYFRAVYVAGDHPVPADVPAA
jgi:hypothetical protein